MLRMFEKEDDNFETEAFKHLNEPKEEFKKVSSDEESSVELSDAEESGTDDEADLLDEQQGDLDDDDDDDDDDDGNKEEDADGVDLLDKLHGNQDSDDDDIVLDDDNGDDDDDSDAKIQDKLKGIQEDDMEDDDDDEAPESVGFATSKDKVLEQIRIAREQIDLEKQKKKDLKRKRLEQFKEQKQKKQKILNTKLPDDILETLDSKIKIVKKDKPVNKWQKKAMKKAIKMQEKEQSQKNQSTDFGGDFISLSGTTDRTSGLEVMKIGEEKTRLKSSAELAAEFRNKRLYGSGIPRETTKQKLAKEVKRKARFR